jgi:hypothetical protein
MVPISALSFDLLVEAEAAGAGCPAGRQSWLNASGRKILRTYGGPAGHRYLSVM